MGLLLLLDVALLVLSFPTLVVWGVPFVQPYTTYICAYVVNILELAFCWQGWFILGSRDRNRGQLA